MYSRVPARFLISSSSSLSQGSQEEDIGGFMQDSPSGEGTPSRITMRGTQSADWARTSDPLSQALMGLSFLTALQQGRHSKLPLVPALTPLACHSPQGTSSPVFSLPYHGGPPRSVLHPDNQRALAKQGYYGDRLPEGVDPAEFASKEKGGREAEGGSRQKAEARRELFHKSRSRGQPSLQEDSDDAQALDERDHNSSTHTQHDSFMKSMAYSTTTESTDSADISFYPANTPQAQHVNRTTTLGASSHPGLTRMEDVYQPATELLPSGSSALSQHRQKLTAKLMSDLDNDDDYDVSPVTSRQPTVEKAGSAISGNAARGGGSKDSELQLERSGDASHKVSDIIGVTISSTAGGVAFVNGDKDHRDLLSAEPSTAFVSLLVKDQVEESKNSEPHTSDTGSADDHSSSSTKNRGEKRGLTQQSLLRSAINRASDSGSKHTLPNPQNRLSSSSGSPSSLLASGNTPEVFTSVQLPQSVTAVSRVVRVNASDIGNRDHVSAYNFDTKKRDVLFKYDAVSKTRAMPKVESRGPVSEPLESKVSSQVTSPNCASEMGMGFTVSQSSNSTTSSHSFIRQTAADTLTAAAPRLQPSTSLGSSFALKNAIPRSCCPMGAGAEQHLQRASFAFLQSSGPRAATGSVKLQTVSSSSVHPSGGSPTSFHSPGETGGVEEEIECRNGQCVVGSAGNAGGGGGASGGRGEGGGRRGGCRDTVLHVYHRVRQKEESRQDSVAQGAKSPTAVNGDQNHNDTEDLARMSSIQSDSSGFGDVEISTENVTPDNDKLLKVRHLGGSGDSSSTCTLASTSTVKLTTDHQSAVHNSLADLSDTADTLSSCSDMERGCSSHTKLSQSTSDLRSDLLSHPLTSSTRFVSMCYIPSLSTKKAAPPPLHRPTAATALATSLRTLDSGHYSKSEICVVLDKKGNPGGVFRSVAGTGGETGITVSRHRDEGGKKYGKGHSASSRRVHEASGDTSYSRMAFTRPEINETPLSEELAQALSKGVLMSSTSRVDISGKSSTSIPTLVLQRPTLDRTLSADDCVSGGTGEEDVVGGDHHRLLYPDQVWERQPLGTSVAGGSVRESRRLVHHPHWDSQSVPSSLGVESTAEAWTWADSAESSSVCSGMSTCDSFASSAGQSELLDCQKLARMINQPSVVRGRGTRLDYKPEHHLRDWPCLSKRKRLQEESRLAQYAVRKYKTVMGLLDTSVILPHHTILPSMTPEEREDIEELQHLWSDVRRHVNQTEQLLTSRLTSLAAGKEGFSSLHSIKVLQKMAHLLQEQNIQKQLATTAENYGEEDLEMEDKMDWKREKQYVQNPGPSLGESSRSQQLHVGNQCRGRYSYSATYLAPPRSSPFRHHSLDQLRTSLLSDVRKEIKSSLHCLQQDLLEQDSKIHQIQLELKQQQQQRAMKSSSKPAQSRSLLGSALESKDNSGSKETEL